VQTAWFRRRGSVVHTRAHGERVGGDLFDVGDRRDDERHQEVAVFAPLAGVDKMGGELLPRSGLTAATISESEPQRSAELLGASGRLLDDADAALEPIERELREAALRRVTSLLGKNVSDALAAGAQLETSDAVERAFSID
jgi:hypothetical protein